MSGNKKPTFVLLLGGMPNPRIYKRIEILKMISDLHLICWDRGSRTLDLPVENGYKIHIISQNAVSDPVRRLIPYANFCKQARHIIANLVPDLIYLQGLDMLIFANAYKIVYPKTRIIYEVADLHRLIVDKQKGFIRKLAHHALIFADRACSKNVDLLVLTSEKYYDTYFSGFFSKERIFFFPNIPDLSIFRDYRKKDPNNTFTVGYIGAVRYKQQIRQLMDAVEICGLNIFIAGFEKDGDEIEQRCKAYPKGEWFGRFDFGRQAAELYSKCDVIYSVYDADLKNVRIALPNKLYEAIHCETPLIVAKNTYLSELVDRWQVGIAVDHTSTEELVEVLTKLQRHPECYEFYVQNCRKHKNDFDLYSYNVALEERIIKTL